MYKCLSVRNINRGNKYFLEKLPEPQPRRNKRDYVTLSNNSHYYDKYSEIEDKDKDIQIKLLKHEIRHLKNELMLTSIEKTDSNAESKCAFLEEENELLNKKLKIFSEENKMLKNKINTLTNIIKENEKFRLEMSERFNCNKTYALKAKDEDLNNLYGEFPIKNPEEVRNKSLKESLLILNKTLDELAPYLK